MLVSELAVAEMNDDNQGKNRKAEMLIGSELANVSGAPTRVELNQ
jgi:hypothetical protein